MIRDVLPYSGLEDIANDHYSVPNHRPPRGLVKLGVRIGHALQGRTLAVAESFSAGLILYSLVAAEGSVSWLRGGIMATDPEVTLSVLGVERAPIGNARSTQSMAAQTATLLGADVGLATTGAAGPELVGAHRPATISIGVSVERRVVTEHAV